MKLIFKYQWPAFMWAIVITILCSISFGSVGESHLFFPGFDKLVHCGLFFVLVVFQCSGSIRQYGPESFSFLKALKLLIIALCFGAVIEVLQMYVFTWRSAELADLFADCVGAGMGVFSILMTLFASVHAKN